MTIRNTILIIVLSLSCAAAVAQDTLPTKNTQAILFTGKANNQPLVVGLGGSEGGNAWASDYWKKTRDEFIDKGYSFLAIGYFGAKGTPKNLDRISLEDVHAAIKEAVKSTKVNKQKIAIIGGSRGGDLALLLASHYDDIDCVVGIVASHAVFTGHTPEFNSSCWTWQGKELSYIPVNEASVPYLMKRDLRGAFDAMLKDTVAEQNSLIPVENIRAPVLLISATDDEICPSQPMAEKIIRRLKQKNFSYYNEHIAIEGKHAAPLQHFDKVFLFLEKYFPVK